tara:strand:- start:2167 stop:2331 length:165 start_codon:yes stop_codon:yes gene_type:complete
MTENEEKKFIVWVNLFIGIYNLYLWSIGGDFFWNFIIGTLNIGAWVFFRKEFND